MRLSVFVIVLVLASSFVLGACGTCTAFTPFKWTRSTGAVWLKPVFWNFTVYGNVTSNDTINASWYCLNGTCISDWNVSGGGGVCSEVYNGTFNETEGVYVYNSTDWRIDFNETKLNQTIDERLNSTTYYPAAFSVDAGVLTGGNLASLFYYDGDTLNVSEAAGANPLIVGVNFTGVTNFDWLLIRERYHGGQGHEIYVQIWNFVGLTWDTYYIISDQAELVSLPPLYVADASEHISATNVSMRFFHLQNGIPPHDLHVDFVQLVDGFSTTTTITHDSLSLRDFDVNHLQYLNRNATRTLLMDWDVGFFGIYNLTHLNATNASFFGNVSVAENLTVGGNLSVAGNLTAASATFVFQSSFRAYNSSDLTIPNLYGPDGLIWWDVENWDVRGEFDNSANSRFTANMSGKYHACVALTCGIVDPSCSLFSLSIYKNGFAAAIGFGTTFYVNHENFLEVCDDFDLAAGDFLEAWARGVPNDGEPEGCFCIAETEKSFFAVHKVS